MIKNYKKILYLFILNLITYKIVVGKEFKINLNKNSVQNDHFNKYNLNKYYNNDNSNNINKNLDNTHSSSSSSSSASSTASSSTSTDIKNLTWDCANNSSCIQSIAKNIMKNYENGENINFELFSIEKIPKIQKPIKLNNDDYDNINYKKNDGEGRSTSTFTQFFNENSVRIPLGPVVLDVKRSDDNSEFMEISLLGKKSPWNQTVAQEKDLGRRHKVSRKSKKHLQIIIPMYLAANTFGWTMLAVKAVTLLAIKAILVSKLAFLVASSIVIKNFMDNSHKMMYPQHFPPPLTSYNMMDYGAIHAAQSIPDAIEEQYQSHLSYSPQQHIVANSNIAIAQQPHQPQQIQQHTGAGSSHHHVIYTIQSNASHPQYYPLSSITGAGAVNGPHIKRKDQWTGVRRPPTSNSLPSTQGTKAK